ncbi:hypothetical protein [Litoreibacter meonggei]|uniref:hypothetical protein n=1 Tax=Litoreibacter meonggei TaxID=1049199 RepID=UPI0011C377F2|nr:hypothetical protein [Litoreibacter meonggei]
MLSFATAGYADYLSGPITATFISLFGIRTALSLMGDHRRTGYDILALYSVLYGVFILVAKGGVLLLSNIVAVVYADWSLGDAISLRSFKSAEESLQFLFAFQAFSAKAIVSLVMYTIVYVVMAVPLANAARAAGQGATSVGFFSGFGRSFVPLFCIFAVVFFLQFFFNMFTFFLAIVPLFLSVISIVLFQTVPNIDLDTILRGIAASAGLLWLHSWVWTASAVALVKNDESSPQPREVSPPQETVAVDIQALRKSRQAGLR